MSYAWWLHGNNGDVQCLDEWCTVLQWMMVKMAGCSYDNYYKTRIKKNNERQQIKYYSKYLLSTKQFNCIIKVQGRWWQAMLAKSEVIVLYTQCTLQHGSQALTSSLRLLSGAQKSAIYIYIVLCLNLHGRLMAPGFFLLLNYHEVVFPKPHSKIIVIEVVENQGSCL